METEKRQEMDVQKLFGEARDAMTVRRVFGEPYEKNGVTIVPAANVRGGAGGGSGEGPEGKGRGVGGGYGVMASPAGAYVIKGDQVRWEPALNLNQVILGAQVVAIVALLALRAILTRGGKR